MTVEIIYEPVSLNGDNITVDFEFNFIVPTIGDLKVTLVDANNDGVIQVNPADYTVVLNTGGLGGTVTMVVAPGDTERLLMELDLATTQVTDIPNVGGLQEEKIEDPLDRAVLNIQLLEALFATVPRFSTIDDTAPGQIIVKEYPSPVDKKAILWVEDPPGTFTLSNSANDFDDLDQQITDTLAAQVAAEAAQAAAEVAQTAAELAETNAEISETNAAASAVTAANEANKNEVTYKVDTIKTIVIDSGSKFIGVDSGKSFIFTSNRTFDIEGTPGDLGALDTGESESNSTWYYAIALGDTTGAVAPHIIGVSAASYVAFTTARLVGNYAAYNDFKRIGQAFNKADGEFRLGEYFNNTFYVNGVAGQVDTTSATFVPLSYTAFVPPVSREVAMLVSNSTTGTAKYRSPDFSTGEITVIGSTNVKNETRVDLLLDASQVGEFKITAGTLVTIVHSYKDDLTVEGQ